MHSPESCLIEHFQFLQFGELVSLVLLPTVADTAYHDSLWFVVGDKHRVVHVRESRALLRHQVGMVGCVSAGPIGVVSGLLHPFFLGKRYLGTDARLRLLGHDQQSPDLSLVPVQCVQKLAVLRVEDAYCASSGADINFSPMS